VTNVRNVCSVIALALAAAPAVVAADKPASDPDRVAALVRQLDDNDFEVRDKADKELRAMGEPVLPLLRKAAKEAASPEVRKRLSDILAAIGPDGRVAALIPQLGSDDFATRVKATDMLRKEGPAALPVLREAREHAADLEIRTRLDAIIRDLSK
jgi:HEAT repeat protein